MVGVRQGPPRWVVASGLCADSRSFRRELHGAADSLDFGADEFVQTLAGVVGRSDCALVVGLSRDSDFVLVTQLAFEGGLALCFKGEHRYRDDLLEHRLEGDEETVRLLIKRLWGSGRGWAASLAQVLSTIPLAPGGTGATRLQIQLGRPEDSAGHLVSWGFGRASG